MATVTKIGPADHGRPLTREEFYSADYEQGYKYEIIDGRLYVSPAPNAPENVVEDWLVEKLRAYRASNPQVINYLSTRARVFIPGHEEETIPEPDVAAYRKFPLQRPWKDLRWEDVSPVLVVEILTGDDPHKDLVRNVGLYLEVPSVKEYWVVDARTDPERPALKVHRRHGKQWRVIDVSYRGTYTTRLLPGFTLTVDPRS